MDSRNTLLIFVPKITNRLGYTLNVLFRDILQVPFEITTDASTFSVRKCAKWSYGATRIGSAPWIKACDLLFETSLHDVEIRMAQHNGPVPFAVYGSDLDFPFDLLAASFYMVSRYEEYMPYQADAHGRFVAQESLAYKMNRLRQPIVEQWAWDLMKKIAEAFPDYNIPHKQFEMEATVDIDAAYCYKNKGVLRTLSGWLRDGIQRHKLDEVRLRAQVLMGKAVDPYDTFDYIIDQSLHHPHVRFLFFPLMADYDMYNKNISYHNTEFCQLLQHIGDYATMGIHTSYGSADNAKLIPVEAKRLTDVVHHDIERNRTHFLRLHLPGSYRALLHYNILHDYTMGFASEVGFRAGMSRPYAFFDLATDSETPLQIHPFCFMDTTLRHYMHLSSEGATNVIDELMTEVAAVGGVCCGIFHNENLCENFGWEGWRDVFETTLHRAENKINKA